MSFVASLNPHVVATSTPPIPLAALWASTYPATPTSPLINLAQGVPGAPPPAEFLRRLGEAAKEARTTTYGDLRGDEGLRRGLARDVSRVYGRGEGHGEDVVRLEDVCLTAGCNLAFYATMVTLAQAGDEIILPVPWYFNHEMTLTQLSLHVIPLPCLSPDFLPSLTLCRSLITSKTKAIVLVTPNNPTGAIYPPALIAEFAELAREKGIALVLDETYREFLDQRPHNLFVDSRDWRGVLIHLFSFSKSYAIPGHRLGALVASPTFLTQVAKTLDCLQINPARVAQEVCEWGIEGIREWRNEVRREISERGEIFRKVMEGVEGWRVESAGAYYAYVQHPFVGTSSQGVAERMARQVGVVVLPGTFFNPRFVDVDQDRYLRFSIANVSTEKLMLVPARLETLNRIWNEK